MVISMMNRKVSDYDVYQKAYEIQNNYPELVNKIHQEYSNCSGISIQYIDFLTAVRGFMMIGKM